MNFSVVLSCSISQDELQFTHNNVQCVAISGCVAAVIKNSVVNLNYKFFDDLIINGDKYYNETKIRLGPTHTQEFLEPEELNKTLHYHNQTFKMNIQHIRNFLYPYKESELTNRVTQFAQFLQSEFNKHENTAFIFLGLGKAVSFWKSGSEYYVFNSHKVGENGLFSVKGVARLFSCSNILNLAHFLMIEAPLDNQPKEFGVYSVQATTDEHMDIDNDDHPIVTTLSSQISEIMQLNEDNQQISDKKLNKTPVNIMETYNTTTEERMDIDYYDNQIVTTLYSEMSEIIQLNEAKTTDDNKQISDIKLNMKPVVKLDKLHATKLNYSSSLTSTSVDLKLFLYRPVVQIENIVSKNTTGKENRKRGRPTKKTKGRPKKLKNTAEEQHNKAVDNNNKRKAKINTESVNKFTETYPEVNRKAVKNNKEITTTAEEQHSKAVDNNNKPKPKVNIESVNKFTETYPEVNRKAVNTNKEKNTGRHLPKILKKSGLIAEYFGEKLNDLQPYYLKNQSLQADNCYKCPHCNARLFEEEKNKTKWCCNNGLNIVSLIAPLNADFYRNRKFLQHPRLYNDLYAFAAVVAQKICKRQTTGLSFMKIQGRMYHKVYDLSYKGPQRNNSAFYIDDGDARMMEAENFKLDPHMMKTIFEFLQSCNPFVHVYKQLYNEPSDNAHLIFEVTTRRTHGPVLGDCPQTREVAAVLCCDNEKVHQREVCIWKIGDSKPHYIDALHALLEPMAYPLLYPDGTPGWQRGMLNRDGKSLTLVKYVRWLLLSKSRFSRFGRLSETWVVDMFARIDELRLRYLNRTQVLGLKNNSGLRAAPYDELVSANDMNKTKGNIANNETVTADDIQKIRENIANDETIQGDAESIVPGRIYLPYTYTGGPRYMQVCYYNSMAIVSRLGGPTYFLTFTANGNWPEIAKSKYPNSRNEPHLPNRVFNLKLTELIKDIRCGLWFGKTAYIIWVIEFQMRGLPHAHICFRIKDGGPTQSFEIDRVIRADIPSEEEADGRLRELVLRHMIHGPCGSNYRKDLPCWDEETQKCLKYFPKIITDTTFIDEKGFVQYQRKLTNTATITYRKKKIKIDDKWVVPYNSALLLKYDCHTNLELASTRSVVKYLFKYITKGSSMRRMNIVDTPVNEVEDYITKRYVGASDAAWRILEFNLTGREPTVEILPIHLEGKHNVIFKPHKTEEAISNSTSKLIIYFLRPLHEEFERCTYAEFYENYILHTSYPKSSRTTVYKHQDGKHFVTARQRGECVSRMFWVSPNRGEQYYLRMLLNIYPCRGYQDLYNLGGEGCTTFQQACRAVGLVDNNKEYIEALQEATQFMTGFKLIHFFVLLCTIGAPAMDLWEQFKTSICEDLLEKHPDDYEKAFKLGLIHIDQSLRRHGSSLVEAGLPFVEDITTELGREKLQYSTKLQEEFVANWEPKLSPDQTRVLTYVKRLVNSDTDLFAKTKLIFIDGPGGYGKTLLLNVIASYVRSLDKVALCVASSGIAALNIKGGITAHSMFKIPITLSEGTGYWSLSNGSQRAELIRAASVIIYDEAPMAHRHAIELLDRSINDLMQVSNSRFGNKIVIFAGDFRQIPPVVEKSLSSNEIVNVSLRSSYLWSSIKPFKLTTPQRTGGETEYTEFLLKLGANNIPQEQIEGNNTTDTVVNLEGINYVKTLDELIEFVFPNDIVQRPDECAKRAILCTHNINMKEVNNTILERLETEETILYSCDKLADQDNVEFKLDESLLNHAEGKGVPNHILKLKIGSLCMIVRNLNFDLNLVNGTKVIIVSISKRLITVRRPDTQDLFCIPRILFKFQIFPKSPIEMLRRQFPLQTCYAISVHKSQGQTIDMVGVDLRSDCFTHGQLYVALSRVRSPAKLLVLVPEHRIVNGRPYTKNVVYKELL